jgi:hypothetical protein
MNFFGYIKLNSNNLIYQPFLISELDTIPQRNLILTTELLPRINLLIAANTGSIAAIFLLFSIISFYIYENIYLRITISIVLLFASILSSSFSIFIPIIYFIFLKSSKNIKTALFLFLIFLLFYYFIILFEPSLSFTDTNTMDYTIDIIESWIKNFNYNFFDVLFGKGYLFMHNLLIDNKKSLLVDIGVFRLMQDAGIVIFLSFISYIFYNIIEGFKKRNTHNQNFIFPLILLTLLSLIHNNWILFPPIFLIAIASICAIKYNTKSDINDKQ